MNMLKISLVAAAMLAAAPALAVTQAITGGVTTVEVTADLAALGLAGAPDGTATVDVTGPAPIFSFDITGGSFDSVTSAALIEHDGSGVTLSAGATSATIGNFLIDTGSGTVSGDITGGASDVTFFTFGTPGASGIPLLISDDLAAALTGVFGAPNLATAEFGLANTAPDVAPIPLPPSLAMLGLGAVGLALLRRKRA